MNHCFAFDLFILIPEYTEKIDRIIMIRQIGRVKKILQSPWLIIKALRNPRSAMGPKMTPKRMGGIGYLAKVNR